MDAGAGDEAAAVQEAAKVMEVLELAAGDGAGMALAIELEFVVADEIDFLAGVVFAFAVDGDDGPTGRGLDEFGHGMAGSWRFVE